jgi:hypothetical protein
VLFIYSHPFLDISNFPTVTINFRCEYLQVGVAACLKTRAYMNWSRTYTAKAFSSVNSSVWYKASEFLRPYGRSVKASTPTGIFLWAGDFSLLHRVQTVSGVDPASYSIGIGGSFHGSKVTGAWSWPLTIYTRYKTFFYVNNYEVRPVSAKRCYYIGLI